MRNGTSNVRSVYATRVLTSETSEIGRKYVRSRELSRNTGPSLSTSLWAILIITQIALSVLESAVLIIQSYVFGVLCTLYSREVN